MSSPKKKPKPSGQLNTIVRLSGVGITMGVTIYLSVWAGKWLDTQFPNEKGWFRIGCTLLGVFLALYNVIHSVNKMNK